MAVILIIIGAAAVYWLQNKLYEKYWNKELYVSVNFEKNQVHKGETMNLIEVITNNKLLPLLAVELKFAVDKNLKFLDMTDNVAVSDKCYKNDIFSLLFYQRITRTLPFVCGKRGFYVIENVDLVSSNLFLNVTYATNNRNYTELTVFPQLADCERLEIPYKKIMGELLSRKYLYEDPFEFRGIREYSNNDTMSSINWKATARTGDLRVNVHDYTSSQEICILLNLETETGWEDDNLLEECISIVAGLADKLIGSNVSMKLICNGCDLYSKDGIVLEGGSSAEHMEQILTSLARIDLKQKCQAFSQVIDNLGANDTKSVLYVMVSVACGNVLQEAFERVACKCDGAIWILPYKNAPAVDISLCPSVEILPWEVTVNEC